MKKNLYAWASISENGTINGKKGDQTGKELRIGNIYDFGQTHIIRVKSLIARRKMAKIAKEIVNCHMCGYSQKDRYSLFEYWKAHHWKFSKRNLHNMPKVNTDCSSFCATVINLGFGENVVPVFTTHSADYWTWTLCPKKFMKLPYPQKHPKKGDMPIKRGKHMIINV